MRNEILGDNMRNIVFLDIDGVLNGDRTCIRSIFWCIETVGNLYGCTLFDIFVNNVKKISIRYPDGFSVNNSINR